jgi:hypothetical protein
MPNIPFGVSTTKVKTKKSRSTTDTFFVNTVIKWRLFSAPSLGHHRAEGYDNLSHAWSEGGGGGILKQYLGKNRELG